MKNSYFGLALALVCGAAVLATAQNQNDVYQVTYFSNAVNVFDQHQAIHVVNPGMQGIPALPFSSPAEDPGRLCATFYVYDSSQNQMSCCSVAVEANSEITLDLLGDLLDYHGTGTVPSSGVIKMVSSLCPFFSPLTILQATPNLRASIEHLEILPATNARVHSIIIPLLFPGTPFLSLDPFEDSPLTFNEGVRLNAACSGNFFPRFCNR